MDNFAVLWAMQKSTTKWPGGSNSWLLFSILPRKGMTEIKGIKIHIQGKDNVDN